MKKNVLIIGAGGVAQVVAHKCAQNNDVLGDIHIASRTKSKCDDMIASVREKKSMKVEGADTGIGTHVRLVPATDRL
jgi:saccharopine dehydrogenase-like NADP-dependent oxidoreductase